MRGNVRAGWLFNAVAGLPAHTLVPESTWHQPHILQKIARELAAQARKAARTGRVEAREPAEGHPVVTIGREGDEPHQSA
jgi:heme exporter protein D